MSSQVWFITGCSTGIGRVLALEALNQGHSVVATARNLAKINDIAKIAPDRTLIRKLDVNKESDIKATVAAALKRFSKIDVLVNNAGYGLIGAIEELTISQIRDQMETNFFGMVELIKETLPTMRQQQNGYIFNVSSMAGLRGFKGVGAYNASKFAVVGLTEALAMELAPFNIKVAVVEPGPYKTDWAGRSLIKSEPMQTKNPASPYAELNQAIETMMENSDGKQPGDPLQIAKILLLASQQPEIPVHFLFGDEAISTWNVRLNKLNDPTFFSKYPHDKNTL